MKKWMKKIKMLKMRTIFVETLLKKQLKFKLGKFEFAFFFGKDAVSALENIASDSFEKVDWYRNSHSFMFIEDMYHSVMPHYSFSKENAFSLNLRRSDPVLEKVLTDMLSDGDRVMNLSQAFSDFMQKASQNIFFYGQSLYEVSIEKNHSGAYTNIELHNLMPLNIKKLLWFYVQYTFPGIAKRLGRNPKVTIVPLSRVLNIEFTKDLGGKRQLFKILSRLKKLHEEIFPKFHIDNSLENKIEFDVAKFANYREREVAILVREFGWDQRESISGKGKGTEYFNIARALKFEKTMAIIRASILKQLNGFLKNELKIENELLLSGLPTVEKIHSLEVKLYEGGINIGEFIKEMRQA